MTKLEKAILQDSKITPEPAALAYEEAIQDGAGIDAFLNLAVLYFVCNDGGYAAHHYLSVEFLEVAWKRGFEVLHEAESRFGKQGEIEFWRIYFNFILLGGALEVEQCQLIAERDSILVPYFHLFSQQKGDRFLSQALDLLNMVRVGQTEKQRYIKSVIEATLQHNSWST
jgi:hypothetical protein